MHERPILFSAAMVRAILDGHKTQTRRLVKPYRGNALVDLRHAEDRPDIYSSRRDDPESWGYQFLDDGAPATLADWATILCPYGTPGDRLWVRETFAIESSVEGSSQQLPHTDGRPVQYAPDDDVEGILPAWRQPHYRATDPAPDLTCDRANCAQCRDHDMGPHWQPSIHMPRWACRLVLEISDVRVERLQAISEADVVAEGVSTPGPFAVHHFRDVWASINGQASWDADPWVWVITFKRITP